MVGTDKIYLGKNSSTAEIGREIVAIRNGVVIRNCCFVESSAVTTWTPVTRWGFGYHVQWRTPTTFGLANNAEVQHVLEFCFCNSKAIRSETSASPKIGRTISADVMGYGVLHRSVVVSTGTRKFRKF